MTVPVWLFVVVLVWAVAMTVFLFWRNPLPFPDRGHRCFAVPNIEAARAVAAILGRLGRLPERFTFEPLPTRQTLMWDNTTVVIRYDEDPRERGLGPNAVSLVVRRPLDRAREAAAMLEAAGFAATVIDDLVEPRDGRIVLLTSDAFDGWTLAFRRHILAMGKPPNLHKLTKG